MDYIVCRESDGELYHHGIKGQKWYVRRFQNEDNTWTEAGKKRYGSSTHTSSSGSTHSGSGGKFTSEKKHKKIKSELTPEEKAERSQHRKDVAKKVAIGVGVASAVVAAASAVAIGASVAANKKDSGSKVNAKIDKGKEFLENNEITSKNIREAQALINSSFEERSKKAAEERAKLIESKEREKKWKDVTDVTSDAMWEMMNKDMAKTLGMTYEAYEKKQRKEVTDWLSELDRTVSIMGGKPSGLTADDIIAAAKKGVFG